MNSSRTSPSPDQDMDLAKTLRTVVVSLADGAVGKLDPLLFDAVVAAFGRLPSYVFAWQSLPSERARITFTSDSAVDEFVTTFRSGCYPDFVIRRELVYRSVLLKYLPVELSETAVRRVLSAYGEVTSHNFCVSRGVINGTREVGMKLRRHLPSRLFVCNFRGLVSYHQQPRTCFNCDSLDHIHRDCPERASTKMSPTVPRPSYASAVLTLSPASPGLREPLSTTTSDSSTTTFVISSPPDIIRESSTASSTIESSVMSIDTSPPADTRAVKSPLGDRSARIPPAAPLSHPVELVTRPHADTRAVKSPPDDRSARIPPVAPLSHPVELVPSTIASSVLPTSDTRPHADTRAVKSPPDDRSARLPPATLLSPTVPPFVPSSLTSSIPSTTCPTADARAFRPTSDDRRARNPPPALLTAFFKGLTPTERNNCHPAPK